MYSLMGLVPIAVAYINFSTMVRVKIVVQVNCARAALMRVLRRESY
jgi:hypothetical protein